MGTQVRETGVSQVKRSGPHEPPGDEHDSRLVRLAVKRAKAGDRSAFAFLYARFADDVCRYACAMLRSQHDAEEATQQVFTKLFAVIGKYEEREVPFLAWLFRVTRNVALDQMRRSRAVPVAEVRGAHFDADPGRSAGVQELAEALSALPPAQREVLLLRHVAGLSPGEIAERVGKSEASIHGLHHRARRALQGELQARGIAPVTAHAGSAERARGDGATTTSH